MKKISFTILFAFAVTTLMLFHNCGKEEPESARDITIRLLKSKTWKVQSVDVPLNTATESSEWVNFTVSFTDTNMTTQGHPAGASAVWPSGSYTVSEDGKTITRGDGVKMTLNPITETNFTAIFTVPDGTEIGGRVSSLAGGYTFNMR